MGPYKLLALDMDGTLLTEEKKISPENSEWIYKAIEAGVTVMFATGRGVQTIQPYVEELKLESPMVSVNGSEVYRAPGDLLQRHIMKQEWMDRLYAMAVENDTWYWAYAVEGLYNKDKWTDDYTSKTWLKFGFFTEDKEVLQKIRGELEDMALFEITNSHPDNLEINPRGISKASGIMEVCNLLGIKMEEVIAMGDSQNDLTMIKSAGLGVAMGNAQEEVKLAADVVTVMNDEHGVARIIREYIFGEQV
ncbi:Cof-type HAD-IIB family hydrolase [Paenibacillus aurantius]|uniref:Cof-type HAD-IIB family hydrolase n=1 Tax=Paenibacillus aurantius TaxID=2918900 RepID=A0AA96LIA0_9BACL|nr:Cof-type HAD-IIB family hydrolase [Paenibacillus aurantius]WNQ12620.1 Cof-type HAD-IIB family hydrolase [Paenibacillus aurantius]